MMSDNKCYIIYGSPGSGKSVQAEILVKWLKEEKKEKATLFSMGHALREMAKEDEGTLFGRCLKEYLNKGYLVPKFLPTMIWGDFLRKNIGSEYDSFVFDGGARRIGESESLSEALKFLKMDPVVFLISVPNDVSRERLLKRGRHDDRDIEVIDKRIEMFNKETSAAIKEWVAMDEKIYTIDGTKTIGGVAEQVVDVLKSL
ncbi:MAG: nucleoside monophosphate kinase [Candidatus Campbellbacteria bacterium]|nr:nucleoside monophosphate kinase [Candidatus Campbellbacteria bacterium]